MLIPSRLNFFVANLQITIISQRAFRDSIRRERVLLQPLIEGPENRVRRIEERNAREVEQDGVVPLYLGVQQIVQFCGELHTGRASTCKSTLIE